MPYSMVDGTKISDRTDASNFRVAFSYLEANTFRTPLQLPPPRYLFLLPA